MNYLTPFAVLILSAAIIFTGCDSPSQQATADLSSKQDSVSYSFGYMYGSNLANEGITDIEMNNFVAGLQKALNEEDSNIDNMAMQNLIQVYLQETQMAQMERQEAEAAVNAEEARAFLEENAQKDDVSVTESGLQYRVIEEGTGVRPTAEDEVEVHYRGTLLSGEEFDSSYERGETATFPLNRVITGWTEGLQLMAEGSTYEFFIPADLAYGSNPPPGSIIPPGAVLIFEVELIDVK